MSLLGLPPELFERVIEAYVQSGPLHEIFRARTICRTFSTVIEHVLLAKTPLQTFLDYDSSMKTINSACSIKEFLFAHREKYLLNHTRCSRAANVGPPQFINQVLNSLRRFAPASIESADYEALRLSHMRELVHTFVHTYCHRHSWLLFVSKPEDLRVLPLKEQFALMRPHSLDTLLSSASAVGELGAVESYLSLGASPVDGYSEFLGNALSAATRTGQVAVIERLLQAVEESIQTPRTGGLETIQQKHKANTQLESAIRIAIDSRQRECAMKLIEFRDKNAKRKWMLSRKFE